MGGDIMTKTNDLTEGKVSRVLLGFFFPMLFTNLLQQIYTFADSAIVGKGLGDNAFAAVGNMSALTLLIIGFAQGITNGFSLMGDRILGITWSDYEDDLCSVYKYEHNDVLIPQYKHLVPFCPDGGGNFYCFDTQVSTNGGNSNRIVFWCSNYNYTDSDVPEITHDCLADFINECVIGWTLEEYDYEGNKRFKGCFVFCVGVVFLCEFVGTGIFWRLCCWRCHIASFRR